jgi:hypothetical protein
MASGYGRGRKPRGAGRKSTGTSTMAQRRAKARKAAPSRGSGRKPQGAARKATGTGSGAARRGSGRKPQGAARKSTGTSTMAQRRAKARALGEARTGSRGSGRRPQGAGRSAAPKKDTRTRGGQGSDKSGNDQVAFARFVALTPEQQRGLMEKYGKKPRGRSGGRS